jgi:alpha-beta hydrolase superfamily lysophospholipase
MPCDLKYVGHKSRAQWAVNPSGTAVVFVHGFGGSSTKSWTNFSGLAPQRSSCVGVDLLFYGYDSIGQHLHPVAADLRKLLDDLFTNPADSVINRTLDIGYYRPNSFNYKRIVVAAHSSGAVIARQSLLEATQAMAPWSTKTRLVCFAPAHHGVRAADLAGECFSLLKIPLIGSVATLFFKTLSDLKGDSPLLKSLKEQTSAAISSGAQHLVAKNVVFARNDPIVETVRFCVDPPPDFIENKTHFSVCQPDVDFLDPLQYIEGALQ